MKTAMPPLALPKREYMENAKVLWEKLGLPPLKPETPWFGYSLGDWTDEWDRNALDATRGKWMDRSESSAPPTRYHPEHPNSRSGKSGGLADNQLCSPAPMR